MTLNRMTLDVSISVPVPAFDFVFLPWVQCSLTMMFNQSFSLTMLLDDLSLILCCSKPSLIILYLWRCTIQKEGVVDKGQGIDWVGSRGLFCCLFLSAMTLNWTSGKTENSYLINDESFIVMDLTRLAYWVQLLIVIWKAFGVSPLSALVRCWMVNCCCLPWH